MRNPVFEKKHWLEYLLYGLIAALLYSVLLVIHLREGNYESLYLLYIGNALFGVVILAYNFKLIYKPYEKKRTVSMLIAAHLTTIIGTALSMIFAAILLMVFYPDVLWSMPDTLAPENAPPQVQEKPTGWLLMLIINALVLNFSMGSFISIVSSYAGKINQTKDKPAHLSKRISDGPVTNDA
ncbi:hypothetical protein SAMN05428949_6413 [Chitinophaga sp. YR627]|uniref:hypothetical protein n=1 Tax=Chitinophaga sp. YR627 TaxID=1881041 RepID=UPI0008EFD755|nr:hypothetical protein [Chitinophaga sp. YR627]SFO73972.1 hypothetical protein SAMN05428949_6413 [Chitinophaga sp. YR627]